MMSAVLTGTAKEDRVTGYFQVLFSSVRNGSRGCELVLLKPGSGRVEGSQGFSKGLK